MEEFYTRISRRPLIDVVQDKEEEEFWKKSYDNSNDITLYSWRNDWLANLKGNKEHFGYFNRENSVKIFANELIDEPIILVGAGSSLANNLDKLKLAKQYGIKIMTSHHALMYLAREDIKIAPDFVCVLDAGAMWDDYFAFDAFDYKNIPLIADQTCNTRQLKKWPGPVKFFRSAHPDQSNVAKYLKMEIDRIATTRESGSVIEVGGHAMGAMLSVARGIMRANTLIFIGADYCFNQAGRFYPFDHKIDKVVNIDGKELPAEPPQQGMIFDIFGDAVFTNGAYLGFKNTLDMGIKVNMIAALQSGEELEFINASEGGALGTVNGGNSKWMQYMKLEDAIYRAVNKRNVPKKEK